jgi:hypothetical protein
MPNTTPTQLRFPSIPGYTIRGDFDGGALSSDFGPLLLRGVDRQIGLSDRLAQHFNDQRHSSYIDHSLRNLFAQRIYQVASGYEDTNDANSLRHDPMFKMGLERPPLNQDNGLASAPTHSRLDNAATSKDIYRIASAFIDQFVESYSVPPEIIVLDMDHSADSTHGMQQLSLYNHHYRCHCYLPLFIFEGLSGKLVTAVLRPGKRPTGAENAMILKRVLKRLREKWPGTHIILRGDGHFSNPELMQLALDTPFTDFIFGVTSNAVLNRLAEPILAKAGQLHQSRCQHAELLKQSSPLHTRLYHEVDYAASSWPKAFRVILKAEVMSRGDNPRFVVTSLTSPSPEVLYKELYCARGQDENFIKMIKNDLSSDRTSSPSFLANHLRLFYACGAYVLHHSLRTETLAGTELANAQPYSIILKLFKVAVRVIQYKDRIKMQLPTSYPYKHILRRITEILFRVPMPARGGT